MVKLTNNQKVSNMIYTYLKVVVDTDIIVLTRLLICVNVGFCIFSLSAAILFKAVLSKTTTESADSVSLLRVSKELYGCTTTSLKY